jgi:hypothetical protein
VRYENHSFFSKLDTHGIYLTNVNDINRGNVYKFRTTASNLIYNLSGKAYDHGSKGFAEGSATYYSNGTIYGLAQCWGDISIKDCRSCLQFAKEKLYECCSMKQGAQALLGSCKVRYEIYPLFDTSPSASSGPNPPIGPFQTPPVNGTSATTSSNVHKISLC